jgi:hypothetical protein
MHTKFWLGSPKERDHSEDLDIDKRTVIKWVLRKSDERLWTGFVWLRMGTGDGLS